MCLLEMSNLVSPGVPKLWESVKKEQKWFVALRFPRLIVPSHIDSHHSMCLLEMSNLVSPGIPKLWESVKKEQKWFVGVSGLHIVQLGPIDSHIVVNAKVRVNQAFWREASPFDFENATAKDNEPYG